MVDQRPPAKPPRPELGLVAATTGTEDSTGERGTPALTTPRSGLAPPLRLGAEPRGSRGENGDEWSEAVTAAERAQAHSDAAQAEAMGTMTGERDLDLGDGLMQNDSVEMLVDELGTLGEPFDAQDDCVAGERGAHADGGGRNLVGNLRACLETWKANTDDKFVLEVLQRGLKLPFLGGVAPRAPYRNSQQHQAGGTNPAVQHARRGVRACATGD